VPSRLQQAITLIETGDKQKGGQLLAELLRAKPKNKVAWLWMSSVVQKDEQRQYCLQKVLELDPDNQVAQKALAGLQAKHKEKLGAAEVSDRISTVPVEDTRTKPLADEAMGNVGLEDPLSASPDHTLEISGIGHRFIAYIVDSLLLFVIFSAVMFPVGAVIFDPNFIAGQTTAAWYSPLLLVLILLPYLIQCIYFVGFWATTGQTPGKMSMGIKVISEDGSSLSWRKAILRYIGYMISSFLALGFIWAAFDRKRQGWHDKIAGTYVVWDDARQIRPVETRNRSGISIDIWAVLIAAGLGVFITVLLSIFQQYALLLSDIAFERDQVSRGLTMMSLATLAVSPIAPLASTSLVGSLAAFLTKPPRSEKRGAVTGALATFVAMLFVIVGSFLIDSLIDPYAPTLHFIVSREARFSQFTYDALCSGISLFCGALAGAFVGRCFPGAPTGK
jgi:uncharacterized RDD family membrane protein YckC